MPSSWAMRSCSCAKVISGFFLDPAPQFLVVPFQAGTSVAPALLGLYSTGGQILLPKALHAAFGNPKEARDFLGAMPLLTRRHNPLSQISAVSLHPPLLATD